MPSANEVLPLPLCPIRHTFRIVSGSTATGSPFPSPKPLPPTPAGGERSLTQEKPSRSRNPSPPVGVLDSVDRRAGGSGPYRFGEPGWRARSAYSPRVRRERRRVSSFALSLLLVGLLANLSWRVEVYVNPEYGFSMLALFGAARYIGVTWRPASPGALDFACGTPIWVPPAARSYPAVFWVAPASGPCWWPSCAGLSCSFSLASAAG
jgi:hypothetical protein